MTLPPFSEGLGTGLKKSEKCRPLSGIKCAWVEPRINIDCAFFFCIPLMRRGRHRPRVFRGRRWDQAADTASSSQRPSCLPIRNKARQSRESRLSCTQCLKTIILDWLPAILCSGQCSKYRIFELDNHNTTSSITFLISCDWSILTMQAKDVEI